MRFRFVTIFYKFWEMADGEVKSRIDENVRGTVRMYLDND
jgi:hypothetical protein